MENKKTLVVGATEKRNRYAYVAAERLVEAQMEMVLIGRKKGHVLGHEVFVLQERPPIPGIHTITMYLSAQNQREYYQYFLSLNPKRVVFNPGAENFELESMLVERGVQVENACTLVLLSIGNY